MVIYGNDGLSLNTTSRDFYGQFYAVLWICNRVVCVGSAYGSDFFGGRIRILGSYMNFSSNFNFLIFDINFTFVFPSCKCVRLHITMRNNFYKGICKIKDFIFF
jgi:hypothetical protein